MIIQFLVYLLLFYLVFRVIRFFIRYLNEPPAGSRSGGKINKDDRGVSKKINKDDIIDADYEEIKNNDNDKG